MTYPPLQIIQIVPRLPPVINGVGDYAYLLAGQLRAAHDIHTIFVVVGQDFVKPEILAAETRKSEIDGFKVYQMKERSADELQRLLSQPDMPQTVLLQYVGYGYEKRGCPVWLVKGLEMWKCGKQKAESRNPDSVSKFQLSDSSVSARRRLVTMFHELYAFGPPWRSSFWTWPIQRWLARRLAHASAHCVTNLRRNVRVLRRVTGKSETSFTVLPVFSNVGEPAQVPCLKHRPPRLAVFGTPTWRRKVYVEHRADLEKTCEELGLTEIVDIGAPCAGIPKLSVRHVLKGSLTAEQVSRELLSCWVGFFVYPVPYLGKSGIFAVYAAHGLAPMTYVTGGGKSEDGLRAGEHFIALPSPAMRTRDDGHHQGRRPPMVPAALADHTSAKLRTLLPD